MRFRKKTKRYFNCVVCGKKVDKKVEGYGLRIFCREHADIFYKDGRDPRVRLKCDFCKKEFHPFRNYKYFNSKRFFCSHQCYTQKRKAEKLDKVCYTINMYKRKIILLDEKQEEQLRKLAFVNRTSQAKIIRDALAFYISNPPKGEKNV
jgi:hypothetical protein